MSTPGINASERPTPKRPLMRRERSKPSTDPQSLSRSIRVMVADDSVVARVSVRKALAQAPNVDVVAAVSDGQAAIDRLATAKPDVLVLDIEMPVKSGIDALPELLAANPKLKVLIVSSLTERNADISLAALRAGAADVLAKPTSSPESAAAFITEICHKVTSLGAAVIKSDTSARSISGRLPATTLKRTSAAITRPSTAPSIKAHPWRAVTAIAIGSSTGGPQALVNVLENWVQAKVTQPIFITQHMPPVFTRSLATHLSRSSGVEAAEAVHGEVVQPGRIYVAPGDYHMQVRDRNGVITIELNQGPVVNFCRPSVDPMLESLAKVYGSSLATLILTGMGRDGQDGAAAASKVGGGVIVQDEATSVVWGMPGAVATAGLANEILPLEKIGKRLAAIASGRRSHDA